jgi:hypothetical protein
LYERTKNIECIHSVPEQIGVLYNLIDDLWKINWKLNEYRPPQELSLVEATTAKHVLKNMVVLRVEKSSCLCLYLEKEEQGSWPIAYEEASKDFATAKIRNAERREKHRISVGGIVYFYEYTEINWDMITRYYRNVIPGLEHKDIHFVSRGILNEKTLRNIAFGFSKIEGALVEEPFKVDKKKKKRQENLDEQAKIIAQIKSTKCFDCE